MNKERDTSMKRKTEKHAKCLFHLSVLVLVSLSMMLIGSACTRQPVGLTADLGQQVTLAPGQSVSINGEPLKLQFVKVVNESRCPKGAQCIWEGQVTCLAEITLKDMQKSMVLTQLGGSPAEMDISGYKISFTVDPYPELNKTIKAANYRLNLTISKEPSLSGGILATFKVIDEQYSIFITNKETIEQVFALQRGESNARIPNGRVIKGAVFYNEPWTWHIDSEDVSMAEMTIEIGDGRPSLVESDVDYWVNTVKYYGPWSAELLGVEDFR
jgi:hypothetical protein